MGQKVATHHRTPYLSLTIFFTILTILTYHTVNTDDPAFKQWLTKINHKADSFRISELSHSEYQDCHI